MLRLVQPAQAREWFNRIESPGIVGVQTALLLIEQGVRPTIRLDRGIPVFGTAAVAAIAVLNLPVMADVDEGAS